jgi:CspA family cold shock protein
MENGTVKWFNPAKGYGFIELDGGSDIFCHISAVERAGLGTLHEGQRVSFEIVPNRRNGKLAAENLKVAQASSHVDTGEHFAWLGSTR